ncbi:MAG: DNA alkylation repair protein [Planctomyces sp.]|jgi:3-methyladenine DNA glycosylase AlkC
MSAKRSRGSIGHNPDEDVPEAILMRKGATTTAAVSVEVRNLLSQGRIEAANLVEWLVVDHVRLLTVVCDEFQWQHLLPLLVDRLNGIVSPTSPKRIAVTGQTLAELLTTKKSVRAAARSLQQHRSDTVRCWGCHLIGASAHFSVPEKLEMIQVFAADENMGVREMAWMAMRGFVVEDPGSMVAQLVPLVSDPSDRIRRFATELTRPCGVWCRHVRELRQNPEIGLPLLEPLRSDPSKYVRDSVANWLNDASKSCPEWVIETCDRWTVESPTESTAKIVRRALRTIRGKTET